MLWLQALILLTGLETYDLHNSLIALTLTAAEKSKGFLARI